MSNPTLHIRVNAVLLVVWIGLVIPTILWWGESIFWIVFMSIYAIIVSHLTALIAALAEKKADENE